jgi:hypothetical protein
LTTRTTISAAALMLLACGSFTSSSGGADGGAARNGGSSGLDSDGSTGVGPSEVDGGSNDAGGSSPCGSNGVAGTFKIAGSFPGTDTICGLALGSFSGATLTIAEVDATTARVTVINSGAGNIDVADCPATVNGCGVKAASCIGSTEPTALITLDLTVSPTTVAGKSSLMHSGCGGTGLSFGGTR